MDVRDYLEIRNLFSTKWDPAVLAVLGDQPCRFLALVRQMRAQVDNEILDGTISRSLDRLQELGYVVATPWSEGVREVSLYQLTADGERLLATYRAMIAAYQQARAPAQLR